MKKFIFSIFALLCALSMNAQEVCGYTAKSVQGIYADLIGGTIVNTAAADTTKAYDGMCYALDGEGKILAQKEMTDVAGFPIGFEFNYLGKKFTHFGICANGYVVLGTADQKLTFKANNSWYGYNGVPYAIGLYNNTRFTRVGADQLQISYKSTSSALCVEFKNVLLSGESKLTKEDALDSTKVTLWSYQLQISKDGTIAWAVKGLAKDTKSGSISMALTEKVYEYVGFTSYSKTDFLTNPVAAANSCSTASTIKATPEGTKVVFVAAPDVVAPTKNVAQVRIYDKKSSQDGHYMFNIALDEPEDADAEAYLMLLSKDAEPDANPVDGVAYVEGDSVGNSKVYASAGTVHNLYGMEPGVYYAKGFAYNKIGAKGPKYLIEGAPMASVATPKAGTTAPDSLWVRTTSATSIGLGVKGNAAGQTIIVAMCDSTYNPGNYGVRPYPGNLSAASKRNDPILDENGKQVGKVVYVGVPNATNGTTFTASSLKASTPYYFVAYASDGEQLAWDPDFVQVWATTAITVPYSVDMNKAPENNQPVGWTSEPGGEYEGFFVQKANIGGDNLHPAQIRVLKGTNTRYRDNDWTASLTSPEVTLTKDCKYTFKWRMDEKGNWGNAGAGHGPENWAEEGEYLKFEVICDGVTTLAKNYTYENAPECLANKEWAHEVIDLSAYSGKKVQVKMTWRCEFSKGVDMYLDSLTFEQYAVTPEVSPSLSFVKRHGSTYFELKANVVEAYEGASDGYVMLVSKDAAPDTTPVDGVAYEDDGTLGNASVSLLSGRILSNNIQKPEEGATYYVTAYAYNNGNGGPKYLIEGAPKAAIVVPTADLVAPAEFKVLDEQVYTDKLSFSVTANAANHKIIVAYNDSTHNPGNYGAQAAIGEIDIATAKAGDQLYDAAGNPCGKIAYVGGTGEFTVEGLSPSGAYYFNAYSANEKTISWDPDLLLCWAATKGVAPYEVNMAAAPAGELPAGWSCTPVGENKGFYKQRNGLVKNLPPSGNPDVFYGSTATLDEETKIATLVSPAITLTNGNTLSFDWLTLAWGRFNNTAYGPSAWAEEDYLKIELLDGENVVELKSYDYETAPVCLDEQKYVSESIDLSAYAGKDVKIRLAWHCVQGSLTYFYMDAFKISAPATPSVDYSTIYTSNVELTTEGGTSATAVKVVIDGTEYDAIKAGTGSKAGVCVVTIPAATKTLHFHAAGWNGKSVKIDVNGTEYTLVADAGVSNNSPFTLQNDPSTKDYFTFDPKGATTITFTATKDYRFVLFGVNAEMQEGIVSAPSFSPSETDFVDSVEISLSCDTEGAEIFYSIGSEVTSMNAIQYTAPFTISETSTIYAVAKKDGKESEQVSKTYNKIPSFASLAELLEKLPAQETSTKVNVTLTDLPIDSFYITKQGYKNGVYTNVNGTVVELYEYNVPETWEVGGTVSGKIIGEWLSYKGTPELQKWEGGWDALTYKPAPLLPPLASNAYYSWQSPKGVVEEVGGKAVAVGDITRVNYKQLEYYTISLNGKKDLSDAKYTTVTLDKALAEGDTIYVYAFKNKDDASKKAGVKFFWGAEGTSAMACGDDFPNLYTGGEPALVKYVVPKDAAGQSVFRMTRSETGTNLFIAQLQIVPFQTPTGINDISAKNAQFFGEGTYDLSGRKVMNPVKGNVYIVNGKKYLCK